MKLKALNCLLALGTSLSISSASTSNYSNSNVYKVNSNTWIKNLFVDLGVNYGYDNGYCLVFDIVFHSYLTNKTITILNSATDSRLVNKPAYEVDPNQAYQYQNVVLYMSYTFTRYVEEDDPLRITHGDTTLFQFYANEDFDLYKTYTFVDSIPNYSYLERVYKLPVIQNGKITNFKERIFLRSLDVDRIKNYYYGKFPLEYVITANSCNFFGDFMPSHKLNDLTNGLIYKTHGSVSFKDTYLFSYLDNRTTHYAKKDTKTFFFNYEKTVNSRDFVVYNNDNNPCYTFEDGKMRYKSFVNNSAPTLLNEVHKDSTIITYPMGETDFDTFYEHACNTEVELVLRMGYLATTTVIVKFTLSPQKDFFYNHMYDYTIGSSFNNDPLDTVDIIYA